MIKVEGKSILKGIAIGTIKVHIRAKLEVSDETVEDKKAELMRFEKARKKSIAQQDELRNKALRESGEASAAVFESHIMMLSDAELIGAIRNMMEHQHKSAEYSVKTICDICSHSISGMKDQYIKARSADIDDICKSLLHNLFNDMGANDAGKTSAEGVTNDAGVTNAAGKTNTAGVTIDAGVTVDAGETSATPVILVAFDLSPSEITRLDKDLLLGFITKEGSSNGHTAIFARSMNIPGIVQCGAACAEWDGKTAIIDGYHSCVYIDPSEDLITEFRKRREEEKASAEYLKSLKGLDNTTIDGTKIRVSANIADPAEIESVWANDAGGVGLFRTEFVYLNSKHLPSEEEQFYVYKRVIEEFSPLGVNFRTCDIGADKMVDYMKLEPEANPELGYRAIRVCLTRKDFFKTQLRALVRASAYGNMSIMFPMIISKDELKSAKQILGECRDEIIEEGGRVGDYKIGTMIETPAAVLCADDLAQICDFFSIGTNDLTQYTLAVDRQNPKLEKLFDPHHPAVIKEIGMTIEAGHSHGIPVAICGELGADQSLTETFLRMGVDELSVGPENVLPLRGLIRGTDLGAN